MYKNLSKYVEHLAARGELRRVRVPVDPELEISEIADRLSKEQDGGCAVLFEDTGTQFPVLCNMMGSEARMAAALGVDSLEELPARIAKLLSEVKKPRRTLADKLALMPMVNDLRRSMPRHKRGKGECQDVIWTGDQVDLSKLPILKTWPHDGGAFVTLPLVHTVDLQSGARNVGMYRMQVLGRDTTALHWHIHKTGARHFEQYKKAGVRMPVAVCLGGDPAYTYAATAPLPDGIDEYILAGFLRRKPVSLVRCITCDIEVPADCDFVIEGYVDPNEAKVVEGPFGDHTGFYSLPDTYPVFHITAITHRKNAIYPATLVGVPPMEDRYIAQATELIFEEPIRAMIAPEVTSLQMPWQGVAHNLAIVGIDKSYTGQALKVASALWGAGQMAFCKYIVVTNGDDSEFSLKNGSFRAQITITDGIADVLDHAGEVMGRSGKMLIDTTSENARQWQLEMIFDDGVEALSCDEKMWIGLANSDPARDVTLTDDGRVVVDARSKQLKTRDFPNIVTMDDPTISLVDRRWVEYDLGEPIPSPSHRYKHLIKGDSAEQLTIDN